MIRNWYEFQKLFESQNSYLRARLPWSLTHGTCSVNPVRKIESWRWLGIVRGGQNNYYLDAGDSSEMAGRIYRTEAFTAYHAGEGQHLVVPFGNAERV